MRGLAPSVTRDAAWERLSRPGKWERIVALARAAIGAAAGHLPRPRRGRQDARPIAKQDASRQDARPPAPSAWQSKLPYLETVWLPRYRAGFLVRSGQQSMTIDALVDVYSGHVAIIDLDGAEWFDLPDDPTNAAAITAERAASLARRAMSRAQVSKPGWGKRGQITSTGTCELIGYPVWAYYFLASGGMLDAKLLDGLTGALGSVRLKQALLATLLARQADRGNQP